jgi:hypothetical protein
MVSLLQDGEVAFGKQLQLTSGEVVCSYSAIAVVEPTESPVPCQKLTGIVMAPGPNSHGEVVNARSRHGPRVPLRNDARRHAQRDGKEQAPEPWIAPSQPPDPPDHRIHPVLELRQRVVDGTTKSHGGDAVEERGGAGRRVADAFFRIPEDRDRCRPHASVRASTSLGQASSVRRGSGSDPPIPGRSGTISLASRRAASSSLTNSSDSLAALGTPLEVQHRRSVAPPYSRNERECRPGGEGPSWRPSHLADRARGTHGVGAAARNELSRRLRFLVASPFRAEAQRLLHRTWPTKRARGRDVSTGWGTRIAGGTGTRRAPRGSGRWLGAPWSTVRPS